MLIIGSRALQVIAPQLLHRQPVDWDLIATWDEYEEFLWKNRSMFQQVYPTDKGRKMVCRNRDTIVEIEISWDGSTAAELLALHDGHETNDFIFNDRSPVCGGDCDFSAVVPSIDVLFTVKQSHRFLRNSPHFLKTMHDWRVMRDAGAQVFDAAWLKRREKETYTYAHPKLDVMKADFFAGDGVEYVYDHDSIHRAVMWNDEPAYMYFKRPGSEVMCDKVLFWAADERTRLASVVEESYVLALERSQIPHPGKWSPRRSFEYALMKVCTSITSGWWREYAYEYYNDAITAYSDDYVTKFWAGVESGVVQKISKDLQKISRDA